MKFFVGLILFISFSANALGVMPWRLNIAPLKEIVESYEHQEVVSSGSDRYLLTESYELNWKSYRPCDVVIVNRQVYEYDYNFNNNRSVIFNYYINLGDLETMPLLDNLADENTNVIPLRSSKSKIRSYTKILFDDGREQKNYRYYQLVWLKFVSPDKRKEFGEHLVSLIPNCSPLMTMSAFH